MIYYVLMAIIAAFGVYRLLALIIIRVGKKRKESDHLFIWVGMKLEMLRSKHQLHPQKMQDHARLAYDLCNGNPEAVYDFVKNSKVIEHDSMTHELKEQCQLILNLKKRIESLEKQAANDSLQKIVETPIPSSKIKFEDVFDESYRTEINKANLSATELIEKLKTLKETIK